MLHSLKQSKVNYGLSITCHAVKIVCKKKKKHPNNGPPCIQLTKSIRVGTWSVETLDATRFAECVLGHVCVKSVCGHVV